MKIKILYLTLSIFTLLQTTSINAQEPNSQNISLEQIDEQPSSENISDMIAQIVNEQAQAESQEKLSKIQKKYDELKKEIDTITNSNDQKDKELNLYIGNLEKRLSEQQLLYDKTLTNHENEVKSISNNSKIEVQNIKERLSFFMIMMIIIFSLIILIVALIGVFFFFYGKSTTEKAIRKAIEVQTEVEIKRFLAEINIEKRLQHQGDHAINRLFTELGDKSRDTIKKLDSIQSEYETTLDSLKTKFKESSAVAIKQQFCEIEIKSKDKLKNLNNVQAEYEITLSALKSKINEISEHLTEKGDLNLQILLKELESKSSDKISELDNIQGEYENTLGSLKSKILEVEEKISLDGSSKIQELIAELDIKSLDIVDKLKDIQSEYETTLSSLEEKINETQNQMTDCKR